MQPQPNEVIYILTLRSSAFLTNGGEEFNFVISALRSSSTGGRPPTESLKDVRDTLFSQFQSSRNDSCRSKHIETRPGNQNQTVSDSNLPALPMRQMEFTKKRPV